MSKGFRLSAEAIRTDIFELGESLDGFIERSVAPSLVREGMVLAVTSKIASLAERRVIPKTEVATKTDLVRREAQEFLGEIGHGVSLTIAHGLLIPSAGIDESNAAEDYYILYPEDPFATARRLWERLREVWGLRDLGVILTDSHTSPLRRGVTGVGLAFWGFHPTETLVGKPDLFGRPFRMTQVNVLDALSAAAVLAMGEGTIPTPIALLQCDGLRFSSDDRRADVLIPPNEDLYSPLYAALLGSDKK